MKRNEGKPFEVVSTVEGVPNGDICHKSFVMMPFGN